MNITGVEAYLLSFPAETRDALLVRISADNGLVGYAPGRACEAAKNAIDTVIAPFLIGHRLTDPDALRILFQQGPGSDAEVSAIYSAVEIALYDLAAKAHDVPVSELIGGRVRERIRLYASASTSEDHVADAIRAREAGFAAYKMRLGRGPGEDLEIIRQVREAVGPDFELIVDAEKWQSYSRETVERLADMLGELRILWLEDPLTPGDHEGYARLHELDMVPLAAGRGEPNELRYLDLIDSGGVDFVTMDVVSQGGYATARRLFLDIARAGLRFAFHTPGTALDVIAAGHLGVCWPESVVRWMECPFPLVSQILAQPLNMERGELIVPRLPGLGIEIDESVIWRYPYKLENSSRNFYC